MQHEVGRRLEGAGAIADPEDPRGAAVGLVGPASVLVRGRGGDEVKWPSFEIRMRLNADLRPRDRLAVGVDEASPDQSFAVEGEGSLILCVTGEAPGNRLSAGNARSRAEVVDEDFVRLADSVRRAGLRVVIGADRDGVQPLLEWRLRGVERVGLAEAQRTGHQPRGQCAGQWIAVAREVVSGRARPVDDYLDRLQSGTLISSRDLDGLGSAQFGPRKEGAAILEGGLGDVSEGDADLLCRSERTGRGPSAAIPVIGLGALQTDHEVAPVACWNSGFVPLIVVLSGESRSGAGIGRDG